MTRSMIEYIKTKENTLSMILESQEIYGISDNMPHMAYLLRTNPNMDPELYIKLFGDICTGNELNILSSNPNLTMDIIKKYDINWDKERISYNSAFTKEELIQNNLYHKVHSLKNENIIPETIDISIRNVFGIISENKQVPLSMIEKYIDKNWNWWHLSKNNNLNIDFIKKYSDKPWNWGELSSHHNITFDDIMSFPKGKWMWCSISENPNINPQIVIKNPDEDWDEHELSSNPAFSFNDIKTHHRIGLTIEQFQLNPNMTFEIYSKYIQYFDSYVLYNKLHSNLIKIYVPNFERH